MKVTSFYIEHMDCSSEEQLIRLRLQNHDGVARLEFDLGRRQLDVVHRSDPDAIANTLAPLNLGARRIAHREAREEVGGDDANRKPLAVALSINLALFAGELVAGLVSGSMSLVADSLDMLADAFVYALSLMAVGGPMLRKRRLAAMSGYLQASLALVGLIEVARRFCTSSVLPDVWPIVVMSILALVANACTLHVLRRTSRGEAHIEASWIFTSNDIKVNLLVIAAGLLVWWSGSPLPDLVAGGLVFVIVGNGARRILAIARGGPPSSR